jgi:hypothetical protein
MQPRRQQEPQEVMPKQANEASDGIKQPKVHSFKQAQVHQLLSHAVPLGKVG